MVFVTCAALVGFDLGEGFCCVYDLFHQLLAHKNLFYDV